MSGQSQVQVRVLQHLPLFGELDKQQLQDFAKRSKLLQYSPQEFIFREGDADDGCYIILCGMVSISTTASDGTQFHVATLGQGDFFGEIAALTGHPRVANVVSITPVYLLRTTKKSC